MDKNHTYSLQEQPRQRTSESKCQHHCSNTSTPIYCPFGFYHSHNNSLISSTDVSLRNSKHPLPKKQPTPQERTSTHPQTPKHTQTNTHHFIFSFISAIFRNPHPVCSLVQKLLLQQQQVRTHSNRHTPPPPPPNPPNTPHPTPQRLAPPFLTSTR